MSARTLADARAELKLARKVVRIAVAALEFYGNPETYFAIGFRVDPPCGDFMQDWDDTGYLGRKPGKRARKALAKLAALAPSATPGEKR